MNIFIRKGKGRVLKYIRVTVANHLSTVSEMNDQVIIATGGAGGDDFKPTYIFAGKRLNYSATMSQSRLYNGARVHLLH